LHRWVSEKGAGALPRKWAGLPGGCSWFGDPDERVGAFRAPRSPIGGYGA
jgi:hypothetical protein